MIKILIINNDIIKESNIKSLDDDNMYKKLGYKNNKNFHLIKSYKNKDSYINIYGKNSGAQNLINTNQVLVNNNLTVYGKALVVKIIDNQYISITEDEFNIFFDNNNTYCDSKNILDTTNKQHSKNKPDLYESDNNNYSSDDELLEDVYCYSSDNE